ncbi:response regulator [Williamsia deligens]|uniref:Transcriptional regulatory protein n=1 Tax=Williamsia deligens TaxID=321325 RepID=A0ABW3G9M4_9NOCA|nr:response regulator [Williamsia deligens]MCP2192882.1 two-component system, CitB family, response regulator [Williamsia deligens]
MSRGTLRVLVVDDDFRVAALHASIVDAIIGFETVARVGSIAEARRAVTEIPDIDLALVDVHLPDGSGIELIRELRCDSIVVTAEDSATALRHAVTAGAMAYLIKPFENTELARRLAGYAQYRRIVAVPTVTQSVVDSAVSAVRGERPQASRTAEVSQTEKAILTAVADHDGSMVADQIAAAVGISPPTARRHLAALVADGRLEMALRYGATGRPKQEYKIVNSA